MRASAILAVTIVVLGLFLAVAAGFALSASWIGIGMLTISATGAIAITLAGPTSPARRTVRG